MSTVICLGNPMRGDDGAGPTAAALLRERGVPALVEQPPNLIDAWAGADDVVVVDCVHSGAAPGTVHSIDARQGPLPAELQTGSTHLLGLGEAIELARVLDRLPARLHVLGIEGHSFAYGQPLSAAVERAVTLVVEALAPADSR